MQKLIKKFEQLPVQLKATIWFTICSFMQKGISMFTTPIFTRLLSTSEYGQYSVFNSWLGIVTILISMNMYAGVYTQGLVKYENDRPSFSSALQGLTLILVVIWALVYFLFHNFWNSLLSLTTIQMMAMIVMIWTSAVFNFWASAQRVVYKYKMLVIITLLVSIAKPFLGIIFVVLANDRVTARILSIVLVEMIAYTWMYLSQMRQGKVFYSNRYWKYALVFNIPLIPHYLSQTVLNSADRIMISKLLTEDKAGIYSLAYSVAMIMVLFNSALSQSMSPWIYTKIKQKRHADIAPIAYLSLVLIACMNLMLIALAPEIIAIFAPPNYYDAIWIISPVAMSAFFMFSYDLFAKFQFYYEKTKLIALASIIGALLNIVLNYIFIPIFDYYAAGYTTLVCYILYVVFHYCVMRHTCKNYLGGVYPYKTQIVIGISAVVIAGGFGMLLLYNTAWPRYTIVAGLIVVLFFNRNKLIGILSLKNKT